MSRYCYDETQKIIRQKIGHQTLGITVAVIMINSWIECNYDWAQPIAKACILLFIPAVYFSTCTIIKNASLREGDSFASEIVYFSIFSILNFLSFTSLSTRVGVYKALVENGKVVDNASNLLGAVFFGYVAILLLVKWAIDKRRIKEEKILI